jgi:hypothetical protein
VKGRLQQVVRVARGVQKLPLTSETRSILNAPLGVS